MSLLMKKNKLSYYVDVIDSGSRPKGGVNERGEIFSLGAEHLTKSGGFDFSNPKMINMDFYTRLKTGKISINDILVVKDGATTGKVSFVDKSFPYDKAAINEHLFRIKINKDKANPKFIFYYLITPLGQSQILSDFRGATVGGIGRSFIEKVEVPEINITTQNKIVLLLDKANSIRQKRRETLRLADEFLRSTFLEMFGDPVVNSKGLPIIKGNDLYELASGKFMPTRNLRDTYEYAVYGGNGITGYGNQYLIDKRTLVIGRVGAYCGSIHMTNEKSWITDNAIYIKKLKKDFDLVYLYYLMIFLKINRFASYSGQPKITQNPLLELELLSPDKKLQNKFSTIVDKTEQLKRKYEQSLQESENLFNSLMQRAFRGEL